MAPSTPTAATPAADVEKDAVLFALVMSKNGFKPSAAHWQTIADAYGIQNKENAQKKFKRAIEAAGFEVVEGTVQGDVGNTLAPKTPRKPRTKAAPTPKKRKIEEVEADEDDEDGGEGAEEVEEAVPEEDN